MAQRDIHGQLVAPAPCPDLAPGLTRRGFSMALTKCFTCGINACTLHSRAGGFPLPALTERQLTMTKLVTIPRRFFDDHADRDLETPEIIKATKTGYTIRLDDPAVPELLGDAEYYAEMAGDMERYMFGICMSAKATAKAIRAAMA